MISGNILQLKNKRTYLKHMGGRIPDGWQNFCPDEAGKVRRNLEKEESY
jgi:hypothetical protein